MPRRPSRLRKTRLPLMVLAALAGLLAPGSAWAEIEFSGLGDVPGGAYASTAVAVSSDGTVVAGTSESAVGQEQGFRWEAGTMVGLGIPAGLPGATWRATDMSADGTTIVGEGVLAVVWDAGGLATREWNVVSGAPPESHTVSAVSADGSTLVGGALDTLFISTGDAFVDDGVVARSMYGPLQLAGLCGLCEPEFRSAVMTAVSDDGRTAAGYGFFKSFPELPEIPADTPGFAWVDGIAYGIFRPGGFTTQGVRPHLVSGDGSVVVSTWLGLPSVRQTFLYSVTDRSRTVVDELPGMSGYVPDVAALSTDGAVLTGSTGTIYGTRIGYRWQAGVMQVLGSLPGGTWDSRPVDMTPDGGVIVGHADSATGPQIFFWTPLLGLTPLEAWLSDAGVDLSGWDLGEVVAVSRDGTTLIGNGTNPNGDPEAWRAVILEAAEPVPAMGPGGFGLLAAAIAGVVFRPGRAARPRSGLSAGA